ncbi:hypothetical protein [Thermoanaerobacterium sp. RBIITD]|uniref:hypothetical protein n=1 Tax=Thermoanaerobacterium sp. RBIITD TaxID=1550240 RepID=UPI000BB7F24B|nr:hypothetical protein [Thermoanaerobacterium sp. RBIITD]SNX54937.1 hypothetical protein SAMN05660242_2688 [Thermoanaerobacterium sp. RBIITD]
MYFCFMGIPVENVNVIPSDVPAEVTNWACLVLEMMLLVLLAALLQKLKKAYKFKYLQQVIKQVISNNLFVSHLRKEIN